MSKDWLYYDQLQWGVTKNVCLKFRYSEKATKFEKWNIFSVFVAFSEYPNFNKDKCPNFQKHI